MGVKEISAEFNEIVPLSLNRLDTSSYGYDDNKDRYTGLRREFTLSTSQARKDWNFSVTGNGINDTDEIAVFLNEEFLGFLTQGAKNQNSVPDQFLLPRDRLRADKNLIEFVQKRPESCSGGVPGQSCNRWGSTSDQKWAVKSMLLTLTAPNVVPTAITLDNTANIYNAIASIQNIGDATSVPINISLYRSIDEVIATTDSVLATKVINGIDRSSALIINFSIAGNLIERSDYLGVCISARSAADISIVPTRCSVAIRASDDAIIVPVLQLLLD